MGPTPKGHFTYNSPNTLLEPLEPKPRIIVAKNQYFGSKKTIRIDI